jgi:hypothetical protein
MDRIRPIRRNRGRKGRWGITGRTHPEFIVHKEVNAEDFLQVNRKKPGFGPCQTAICVIAGYDKSEEYRYLFKDGNKALHRSVRI